MRSKLFYLLLVLILASHAFEKVNAQVRDITFVVSSGDYYDIDYNITTPHKLETLVSAIRDVYFHFVSSDTTKFERTIKPIIIKDSNNDFYSSLPNVVIEHSILGEQEYGADYAKYTISIRALTSFCREKGINCNLANQTLGAEMKRYLFMQNATEKVYKSLYSDLAKYCGFVGPDGHLYDYELKVGDPYPYEKEGLSVLPLSLVTKQNENTRNYFDLFINVLNTMRVPDSVANLLHEKGYKTYKNIVYTLPPADWQNMIREKNPDDPNPIFYINESDFVVEGEFYKPLDRYELNGIFERIHSRFVIHDNLTEKEECASCICYNTPYIITNNIKFVAEEAYSEMRGSWAYSQFQNECTWYISDMGYTSGAYGIRDMDNGCMVLLAKVDSGDIVTVSKTFNVIVPTEYLMKITSIDVDHGCGLETDGQIIDPTDENSGGWTIHDERGFAIPWSIGSYEYENYQMIYDHWDNSRPIIHKSLIKQQ